jgi:outer membrane protein, multidrug efflux system
MGGCTRQRDTREARDSRVRRPALVAGLLLGAFACSPHKVTRDPAPPVDLPEAYLEARAGAPAETWWLDLDDPHLEALITRAFAGNLELAGAWARLEQARAVAKQVGAGRWPQISAEVSATRQEIRNLFADADDIPIELAETIRQDLWSATVGASYELDLWRRLSSRQRAAILDAEAARDDAETLAISLAAQVAEVWYDLVVERARLRLLHAQVELNETFLELVTLRFRQGLASALDVHQQRQQLVATRAQLPLAEARAQVSGYQLAVLVGAPPTEAGMSSDLDELPPLPPPPATGLPADLLERRPDVRAARRRVEAADYQIAAAIADRLPRLSLTGSAGTQSRTLTDLLTTPIWSLAASLGQVIFDGGRLAAEVDRATALRRELTAMYGQSLLQALLEVEGALTQERQQRLYIEERRVELDIARAALDEARNRYRQGLSDFLPVLTALQSVQALEIELLGAEREALSYRIQLFRALGGSWPAELSDPQQEGRA